LGADCITLESISVNRDFKALEAIRKAVRAELQLIANSNCMMFCPLSGQHMVNLSHASQSGHKSRGFMIDYCALRCSHEKLKDPVHFLRSEFIRPEDMDRYISMGYDSFKILERGAPTGVMVSRIRAYSEGRFKGNLLDLIQPYGYKGTPGKTHGQTFYFWRHFLRPGNIRFSKLMNIKRLAEKRGLLSPLKDEPVYIDNVKLDGFIEGFIDRDCRRADCEQCGHCRRYAERAVRVDEKYRAEIMREYSDVFEDMHSGAAWGI